MIILIAVLFLLFLVGIGLLVLVLVLRRRSAVPAGEVIYSDTEQIPGFTMTSKTMPLVGKPDYLIKKDGMIIPVEIKRGRTPYSPYANHVAQLYAYCVLVTEQYGSRPSYGVVSYPEKKFTLQFPDGVEESIKATVTEILQRKQSSLLRQNQTQVCRNCRDNHH
jgi:CRISPR-associated exonuclease Cas4